MLVPLTKGQFAVIDECDAAAVGAVLWCAGSGGYPYRGDCHGGDVYLHRFIWDLSGGADTPEVDHKDLDQLNCRRGNLRAATHAQNMRNRARHINNRSGFKGVVAYGSKWRANISIGGRDTYLGTFATPEEAHAVYMAKAREVSGEFARAA